MITDYWQASQLPPLPYTDSAKLGHQKNQVNVYCFCFSVQIVSLIMAKVNKMPTIYTYTIYTYHWQVLEVLSDFLE